MTRHRRTPFKATPIELIGYMLPVAQPGFYLGEGTVFDHLTKVGLCNSFIWKQKYITNERCNT